MPMTPSVVLMSIVLAALLFIAWQLSRLLAQIRIFHSYLARMLQPIRHSDFDGSRLHLNDWIEGGPRTTLDQLIAEVWLLRRALEKTGGHS